MGKFKNFLNEKLLKFHYSISYVNAAGDLKVITARATSREDALNKFKGFDAAKGFKEIVLVKKGDVVLPNENG